ncbi:YcxB family protein [Tardiphaga alba]|uniref:YcxB family protein n=1 Tax=Tardiphaga alba TaxID=340268 RepID=A0ABX8AD83_9BRAD|nr:hypothetical protein [Tardiphaga alba]QUS40275.1 YcxB family protein [Tardiphaga alba]
MAANQYSYAIDLTPDDYRQFYSAIGRHQGKPPNWVYAVAMSLCIPAGIALASLTRLRPVDIGLHCGIAFLLGMFAMFVAVRFATASTIRQVALIGVEDCKRFSVSLDDEGVEAWSERFATKGRWSAVKDLTIENGALMVWLGRLQAVRIPDRAFADITERDAVVAFIRSRMTS